MRTTCQSTYISIFNIAAVILRCLCGDENLPHNDAINVLYNCCLYVEILLISRVANICVCVNILIIKKNWLDEFRE